MTTTPIFSALPSAVKRYLEAVNQFDALVAADCFTADASVFDENQSYVGRDAIRAWIAECSRKYRPAFTVMRAFLFCFLGGVAVIGTARAADALASPWSLWTDNRLRPST